VNIHKSVIDLSMNISLKNDIRFRTSDFCDMKHQKNK